MNPAHEISHALPLHLFAISILVTLLKESKSYLENDIFQAS